MATFFIYLFFFFGGGGGGRCLSSLKLLFANGHPSDPGNKSQFIIFASVNYLRDVQMMWVFLQIFEWRYWALTSIRVLVSEVSSYKNIWVFLAAFRYPAFNYGNKAGNTTAVSPRSRDKAAGWMQFREPCTGVSLSLTQTDLSVMLSMACHPAWPRGERGVDKQSVGVDAGGGGGGGGQKPTKNIKV